MLRSSLLFCTWTFLSFAQLQAQPGFPVQSFGTNGILFLPSDCWFGGATSIERAPDAKLLVGGGCDNDGSITRLQQDGTLDTTFGDSGTVHLDLVAGAEGVHRMHVAQDGRMTIVFSNYDSTVVARLGPDGSLDQSFAAGQSIVIAQPGSLVRARHLLVNPNAEVFLSIEVNDTIQIRKYTATGDPDSGFGLDGVVYTTFVDLSSNAGNLVVDQTGRLLLYWRSVPGGSSNALLTRFNSNGSIDSTFGAGGTVVIDQATWDEPWDVLPLSSGQVLVTGGKTGGVNSSGFATMLDATGALVPAFGLNGTLTLPFLQDTVYHLNKIVPQPTGGFLLSGALSVAGIGNLGVARVTSGGQLDAGFGNDGIAIVDLPGDGEGIYDALLFDDLDLACVGVMSDFGPFRSFLMKIETGLNVGLGPSHVAASFTTWPNPVLPGEWVHLNTEDEIQRAYLVSALGMHIPLPTIRSEGMGTRSMQLPLFLADGLYRMVITGPTYAGSAGLVVKAPR